MDRNQFNEYWQRTEIIRDYQAMLHTFGDTELHYLLVADHPGFADRSITRQGTMVLQRPQILLPGRSGPDFGEGFEHGDSLPGEALYVLRALRLPYSRVSNRVVAEENIEYGTVDAVLDRFYDDLDNRNDRKTGLIKGVAAGADISLMYYAVAQMIKSAPDNVKHFFEHLRRQRGGPIDPAEQITEEEIRRLFDSDEG